MVLGYQRTMTQGPQMKPWISKIHPYVPGRSSGAGGQPLIKLSANENPLGCGEGVLAALAHPADPARYPDPDALELRQAIGDLHGIEPSRIVCAAGSGDLLGLAAQAFAGPGDEVLFTQYSFSLYEIAAHRCGAEPVAAAARDYATDVDTLLGAVTPRTKVVFLANPNNPTGTYLSRDQIDSLHRGLPADVLLVLDQAYAEYVALRCDDGGLQLAHRHRNVLVTRTFSKIYGLAGERIGWATGAPSLIDALNRIRGPFNVTSAGQRAALAALADQSFVERSAEHNRTERARFGEAMTALGNHGVRIVPSEANFLLVLFEGAISAERALAAIAGAGYSVRHLPGQGLPDALRITIGRRADMDRIAQALRAVVVGAN